MMHFVAMIAPRRLDKIRTYEDALALARLMAPPDGSVTVDALADAIAELARERLQERDKQPVAFLNPLLGGIE